MPTLNQKGIAHILLILILLLGLGAGVFLTQKPTNLKPKASEENIWFVDDNGNKVTEASSDKVKVKVSVPYDRINYNRNFISVARAQTGVEDIFKDKVSILLAEDPNFTQNTKKRDDINKGDRAIIDYQFSKTSGKVQPGMKTVYAKFILRYAKEANSTEKTYEINALPFPATITYTGNGSTTSPIPTPTPSSNPNSNRPDLKITNIETYTKKMVYITLCHSGSLLSSSQKYGLKITNKDSNIGGTVDDISTYVWPNRCIGQEVYCKGDCFPGKVTSVNMEVEIDPTNIIDESDETNNKYSTTIQKPPTWPGGGDDENPAN